MGINVEPQAMLEQIELASAEFVSIMAPESDSLNALPVLEKTHEEGLTSAHEKAPS